MVALGHDGAVSFALFGLTFHLGLGFLGGDDFKLLQVEPIGLALLVLEP